MKYVLVNFIDDNILLGTLINAIPYTVLIISIVVLMRSEIVTDFKKFKKSDALTMFKICAMGLVAGYFGNYLGSMISMLFGGDTGSANQAGVEQFILSKYGIIFVIITVFVAPIVEELVFRKAVHGILRAYNVPTGFILLISSVLFGLIHVISAGDFVYIFPYMFMGLVLGGLEVNTKNIYPSIIVHMINNAAAVIMTLILNVIQPLLPQI